MAMSKKAFAAVTLVTLGVFGGFGYGFDGMVRQEIRKADMAERRAEEIANQKIEESIRLATAQYGVCPHQIFSWKSTGSAQKFLGHTDVTKQGTAEIIRITDDLASLRVFQKGQSTPDAYDIPVSRIRLAAHCTPVKG